MNYLTAEQRSGTGSPCTQNLSDEVLCHGGDPCGNVTMRSSLAPRNVSALHEPARQISRIFTHALSRTENVPSAMQVLQDATPAPAAPAAADPAVPGEAPVTASAPEVSGIEAGIQNSVMGMMGSMGGDAAGAGPVQYPEYVAPPLPQCPPGKQQCSRPECGVYNGCWEPSPLDASGWKCKCLSPPPPPAPGSPNWLSDPKNQVQAPPQGEIANSAMLGMYESGKIALNLEKYLKASADKLESQAELGRMVMPSPSPIQARLSAPSPCHRLDAAPPFEILKCLGSRV
jgi:hypothetical protein